MLNGYGWHSNFECIHYGCYDKYIYKGLMLLCEIRWHQLSIRALCHVVYLHQLLPLAEF